MSEADWKRGDVVRVEVEDGRVFTRAIVAVQPTPDGLGWTATMRAPDPIEPVLIDGPPSSETLAAVLDAETRDGTTVRAYLTGLLRAFWRGEADAKYGMTGESDWRYDLYEPLRDLGLIPPWRDGYGVEYPEDGGHGDGDPSRRERADALIGYAIDELAADS